MRKILVAIVLIVLTSVFAISQESEELDTLKIRPDTPQFEQDISVRLQLIDVTVVDRDGNYLTDLTKDDFTVHINGNPVPIRTFDAYFRGQRGGIEDLASGNIPNAVAPSRRLVLFFDQAYTSFKGLQKAKAAAIEFIRRNMSPGDVMMVAGFERSFKIYQEFTRDREELESAVESIKFALLTGNKTSQYFENENVFNTRMYLQTMSKLANYLKSFQGRKTMILLSEGFDQSLAVRNLLTYQREMLESFNDSNTSIFAIDAVGISGPGLGSASATIPVSRARGRHDTLAIFSNETGGKFYRGNNNIMKLMLNIDDDISNYYVLGVIADNAKDGKFREVEVKVNREGADAISRKGYFADKEFDRMSGDEKLFHLDAGFHRTLPIKEFNVEFSTHVFPRSDGSAIGTVVMEAPLEVTGKQEFELYATVVDSEEEVVDAAHKRFYFDSSGKNSFYHIQPFVLASGENLIKLVLRDNRTGKRCYQFITARMPEMTKGLHASTIAFADNTMDTAFVSNKAKWKSFKREFRDVPASEPADPLAPLTRKNIFVNAMDQIKRNQMTGLVLKLSGISDQTSVENINIKVNLRNEEGTRQDVEIQKLSMERIAGSNEAIVLVELDLSEFSPGEYIMTANIEDSVQNQLVGQRKQIVLQ